MQKLDAQQIAQLLETLPAWRYDAQEEAIRRDYVFADFTQAFAFMTYVAIAAEKHNHHPQWSNLYNRVSVTWTTHDVNGLSMKDIDMARMCDHAAS